MDITLCRGVFGYVIIDNETKDEVLVQIDFQRPGVARTFGWVGDDDDIEGATKFLNDNIGAEADDPGYFMK